MMVVLVLSEGLVLIAGSISRGVLVLALGVLPTYVSSVLLSLSVDDQSMRNEVYSTWQRCWMARQIILTKCLCILQKVLENYRAEMIELDSTL